MPLEHMRHFWLATLSILLLVIAAVTLMLLIIVWRRHDGRYRVSKRREPMPDVWHASGQRLLARLQKGKKDSGQIGDDDRRHDETDERN